MYSHTQGKYATPLHKGGGGSAVSATGVRAASIFPTFFAHLDFVWGRCKIGHGPNPLSNIPPRRSAEGSEAGGALFSYHLVNGDFGVGPASGTQLADIVSGRSN